MCRPYGIAAKTMLHVATNECGITQDSLTEHINSVLRRQRVEDAKLITRASVANWSAGRENAPGDILALTLHHVNEPHQARVAQAYLDAAGVKLLAVPRPRGVAEGEEPLVIVGRHFGAAGRLVEAIVREHAPDSPGGEKRTHEELVERLQLIAETEAQIAQLRAETEAELAVTPSRQGTLPMARRSS